MTAIQRVCPNCGSNNADEARFCSACGAGLQTDAPLAGTRKTVTVLFCDATSSTALGERLDPEAVRNLMTRYFDVMREVIEFHGGFIEKFIGDAVLAVFGLPIIHEDDAIRACRAAVEVRDRLGRLDGEISAERGTTIEWRMGINTGEVVVGDASVRQRIVTGDAINVAARLQTAASPGEILIGSETHALVRGLVDAEAADPLTLKGKAEPFRAWRLTSVHESSIRRARPLEAPLVGRRRHLGRLDDAFREAVEERVCHLFTVLGVAGVGKSRLVDEFVASLGDQASVAVGQCLPYGKGITYWPVAQAIRHGAGIPEDAAPKAILARLRSVLGEEPEGERVAAIVSGLLGIDGGPPAPDEIFWAIRKTFEALARRKPLILIFDDVHWGEPTFLDLVEHIAEWARDAPILLIVMARAELLERREGWGGGRRWATTISVEGLSEIESEELLSSLLGHAELPAELQRQIGQAAEGNPLFLEELLGKLMDDGVLVLADGRWSAPADMRQLAIPSTIQALLAARLDGLGGEERSVIERASVEGKTFHRGAVTELAPEPLRGKVRDRLASLMRMELVRPDQASFPGEDAYRFRHLLIRDAAYQALAKQTRSELHERFAGWLERMAGERLQEYEEIVAYHLEQAYRYRAELGPPDGHARDLALRAGMLLADAAERADARADAPATVDLSSRAVELLPHESPRRRRLLFVLGTRTYDIGDGQRAEQILGDAVAEAERANDEGAAALAALGLLNVRFSTQAMAAAEMLPEFEHLAGVLERVGDVPGARLAEAWAAFTLLVAGRAGEAGKRARALGELGAGQEPWQREARISLGASMVHGPTPVKEAIAGLQKQIDDATGALWAMGANQGIGRLLALQGRFAEARERVERARRAYEELGNRFMMVAVIASASYVERLAGDAAAAAKLQREAYDAMTAIGDRAFASTMAADLAEAMIDLDADDEAWRLATIARDTSANDDVTSQAGGRAIQARVLSRRGDHDEAVRLAREAVAITAGTDSLVERGDMLVHLAQVLWSAGEADDALATAREAVGFYQRKGATLLATRAQLLSDKWTA